MRNRHPLLLGFVLALAAAAPAAAAETEVKAQDSPAWSSAEVTIQPGDTVRWTFDGTQLPHNVMSSDDTSWSFRTAIGAPAPPAAFTFQVPGRYAFVCEVHQDTMSGTVVVGEPPPPPPGRQPLANDSPLPGLLETGGLDRARPALRALRVRGASNRATIRFRVSERSLVTVRFTRGGRTVATRRVSASGRHRLTIRRLPPGRYRVEARARDVAGNPSAALAARLTVR